MLDRIEKAAQVIREKCGDAEIGLILGSGLADTVTLENEKMIEYSDIPDFPISTAVGHKSEWVSGTLSGKKVCLMRGRFHYYEGYSSEDIILPIRVMHLLGVKTLIVTNAAGGINTDFKVGELMLIRDHVNFGVKNPLIGQNLESFGPRFFDMTTAYDPEYAEAAHKCADKLGIKLNDGVYFCFSGPSYETPAEIRLARTCGGDAAGMSTVPEVIAARHCGMRVLGISCITNMAAGVLKQPICHEEVIETGKRVRKDFSALITSIVGNI